MKIKSIAIKEYQTQMISGEARKGILLHIQDDFGNEGWGDIAPLPNWSRETLNEALSQLSEKKEEFLLTNWTIIDLPETLEKFALYPSVLFGLESAILSILAPLPAHTVPASALFLGTSQNILKQAGLRHAEGFTSAKLKVSHLSFDDAAALIDQLKDKFRLRIDVNRAWETQDSLNFFGRYPKDAFDYVEEPFKNPKDLREFTHPLAVDESYPLDLSLQELEGLPNLKAIIYKPTIQGGLTGSLPLLKWARRRNIAFVLSSSFESEIGLAHIASISIRLSLPAPVGIGTYHHHAENSDAKDLQFKDGKALVKGHWTKGQ